MSRRCTTTTIHLPDETGQLVKTSLNDVVLWARDPLAHRVVRVRGWKDLRDLERRGGLAGGWDGQVLVVPRERARQDERITAELDGIDNGYGRIVRLDHRAARGKPGADHVGSAPGMPDTIVPLRGWSNEQLSRRASIARFGELGRAGQRVAVRDPDVAGALAYNRNIDPAIWRALLVGMASGRYPEKLVADIAGQRYSASAGTRDRLGADDALRLLEIGLEQGAWPSDVVSKVVEHLEVGGLRGQDARVASMRFGHLVRGVLYRQDLQFATRLQLAEQANVIHRYGWLACETSLEDREACPTERLVDLLRVETDARFDTTLFNRQARGFAADVFAYRPDVAIGLAVDPDVVPPLLPVLARVSFVPELHDVLIDRLAEQRDVEEARQALRLLGARISLSDEQRARIKQEFGKAVMHMNWAPEVLVAPETADRRLIDGLLQRAAIKAGKTVRDARNDELCSIALAVGGRLATEDPELAMKLGRACAQVRVGQEWRRRTVEAAAACGVEGFGATVGPKKSRKRQRANRRVIVQGARHRKLADIETGDEWYTVSAHLDEEFGADREAWQLAFGIIEEFDGSASDLVDVVRALQET